MEQDKFEMDEIHQSISDVEKHLVNTIANSSSEWRSTHPINLKRGITNNEKDE